MIPELYSQAQILAHHGTRKSFRVEGGLLPTLKDKTHVRSKVITKKKGSIAFQRFRPSNLTKQAAFKWNLIHKSKIMTEKSSSKIAPEHLKREYSQKSLHFESLNASRIAMVKKLSVCLFISKPPLVLQLERKYNYLKIQLADTQSSMEDLRKKILTLQGNSSALCGTSLYLQVFVSNLKELQKAESYFKQKIEELHEVLFRVPEVELDSSTPPLAQKPSKEFEEQSRLDNTVSSKCTLKSQSNFRNDHKDKENSHFLSTTHESLDKIQSEKELDRESVSGQMEVELAHSLNQEIGQVSYTSNSSYSYSVEVTVYTFVSGAETSPQN